MLMMMRLNVKNPTTDAILPLIADSLAVQACRAGVCRVSTVVCQSRGRLRDVSHCRWELFGNITLGSWDGAEGYPSPETAPAYMDPPPVNTPACGGLPHLLWGVSATLCHHHKKALTVVSVFLSPLQQES